MVQGAIASPEKANLLSGGTKGAPNSIQKKWGEDERGEVAASRGGRGNWGWGNKLGGKEKKPQSNPRVCITILL